MQGKSLFSRKNLNTLSTVHKTNIKLQIAYQRFKSRNKDDIYARIRSLRFFNYLPCLYNVDIKNYFGHTIFIC